MTKEKQASKNRFNFIKNNPEEIIKWCEYEIGEYKKLIKLLKSKLK